MLERTFVHVAGVGPATERALWDQGCTTWHEFLASRDGFSCGPACRKTFTSTIESSVEALAGGNHQYFAKRLRPKDAWRAFPEFRHKCVYLDIETDGGMGPASITTIGMYDGREYRCLVKGEDLGNFPDIISQYSMIVTFFGAGFDVPVLEKAFRGVQLDQIHLDLCPLLRKVGYRGGLKRIEHDLGITRSPETQGLDGLDAVRLWRRYTVLREEKSLELLIAYNREDVVNLEPLAIHAYEQLAREATNPVLAEIS